MGTVLRILFRSVRAGGDTKRSTYRSARRLLVAVAGLGRASCISADAIDGSILWVAKIVEADVSKVSGSWSADTRPFKSSADESVLEGGCSGSDSRDRDLRRGGGVANRTGCLSYGRTRLDMCQAWYGNGSGGGNARVAVGDPRPHNHVPILINAPPTEWESNSVHQL